MGAMPSATTRHIEQLRAWRNRTPQAKAFGDVVPGLQRQLRRTQRQVGEFAEVWNDLVPPPLRDRSRVDFMRSGTARVTAESSAIAFQLDRALRSGLLRELRASCNAPITRVDVRVGLVQSHNE